LARSLRWLRAELEAALIARGFASQPGHLQVDVALSKAFTERVLAAVSRVATSEVVGCAHFWSRPTTVLLPLWQEDHVYCPQCWSLARPEGEEQWRCDLCQEVSRDLTVALLPVGWVLIGFGVCGACRRREDWLED